MTEGKPGPLADRGNLGITGEVEEEDIEEEEKGLRPRGMMGEER